MELIQGKKKGTGMIRLFTSIFQDKSVGFRLGMFVGVARERLLIELNRVDNDGSQIYPIAITAPIDVQDDFQRLADHCGVMLLLPEEFTTVPGMWRTGRFIFVAKPRVLTVVK